MNTRVCAVSFHYSETLYEVHASNRKSKTIITNNYFPHCRVSFSPIVTDNLSRTAVYYIRHRLDNDNIFLIDRKKYVLSNNPFTVIKDTAEIITYLRKIFLLTYRHVILTVTCRRCWVKVK